jgi:hypothetical protein
MSSTPIPASYAGPQLLLTIYNFGQISFERTQAVFENLSLSLTNHMRANPYKSFPGLGDYSLDLSNPTLPAQGLSYTTKTCLHVRWGWLAFPTSLAVLTLSFFTGVYLSARELDSNIITWKSSPLPLLFYGFPLSKTPPASQHISDLDQAAETTLVGLAQDEDGNMVLRKRGGIVDHDSRI